MFISYRRSDSAHVARLMHERLEPLVTDDKLFLDVAAIQPGQSFPDKIRAAIQKSNTMLVVIGPGWAGRVKGRRRLDDPNDHVANEVAEGLRMCRVVPVLVDGARMPREDELPASIKALASLNAFDLRHEKFDHDMSALVRALFKGPLPKGEKFDEPMIGISMVFGGMAAGLIFLFTGMGSQLGLALGVVVFGVITFAIGAGVFWVIDKVADSISRN